MRFLVITNAPTLVQGSNYVAYAPYVREMNIWCKFIDTFTIVSPTTYNGNLLVSEFEKQPEVVSVQNLNFTSIPNTIKSAFYIPQILFKIFAACKQADHIHLRCPGNIGLLGCMVQIFFPKKTKTAKYAGNWDPNAKQPKSYKFQKWILSNTMLTKNMQVLVYGHWKDQSKNIRSFFTASFTNDDKHAPKQRDYNRALKFLFIGALVEGKRPQFAIDIIKEMHKRGFDVSLGLYGDGVQRKQLQQYVNANHLNDIVSFMGNTNLDGIKQALNTAHFLILPSKSEGWPKAIAEAMFYGVIPIATRISCVPYMLDYGKRGILIAPNVNEAVREIMDYITTKDLQHIASLASQWSQQYTMDYFEAQIKQLL